MNLKCKIHRLRVFIILLSIWKTVFLFALFGIYSRCNTWNDQRVCLQEEEDKCYLCASQRKQYTWESDWDSCETIKSVVNSYLAASLARVIRSYSVFVIATILWSRPRESAQPMALSWASPSQVCKSQSQGATVLLLTAPVPDLQCNNPSPELPATYR